MKRQNEIVGHVVILIIEAIFDKLGFVEECRRAESDGGVDGAPLRDLGDGHLLRSLLDKLDQVLDGHVAGQQQHGHEVDDNQDLQDE